MLKIASQSKDMEQPPFNKVAMALVLEAACGGNLVGLDIEKVPYQCNTQHRLLWFRGWVGTLWVAYSIGGVLLGGHRTHNARKH